jgi:hypothetical protein
MFNKNVKMYKAVILEYNTSQDGPLYPRCDQLLEAGFDAQIIGDYGNWTLQVAMVVLRDK